MKDVSKRDVMAGEIVVEEPGQFFWCPACQRALRRSGENFFEAMASICRTQDCLAPASMAVPWSKAREAFDGFPENPVAGERYEAPDRRLFR